MCGIQGEDLKPHGVFFSIHLFPLEVDVKEGEEEDAQDS